MAFSENGFLLAGVRGVLGPSTLGNARQEEMNEYPREETGLVKTETLCRPVLPWKQNVSYFNASPLDIVTLKTVGPILLTRTPDQLSRRRYARTESLKPSASSTILAQGALVRDLARP